MLMLKPLPINQSATNASISIITFIVPTSFTTHEFAHVLDSLVRVSRRVKWNNIVTIYNVRKMTHPPQNSTLVHNNVSFSQHNPTILIMFKSGSYKKHSSSRSRATMLQELCSPTNRRWHTRQEASHASRSDPTTLYTLMQQVISIAQDNLTMQN